MSNHYIDRISEALAALSITQLWEQEGMPGKPGKSCHSPFREDKKESFSVYWYETLHRERWKDHATDEGGDAIDFFAKWRGISRRQAIPLFIEIALGSAYQDSHNSRKQHGRLNKPNGTSPFSVDPIKAFVPTPEKEKDCWDGKLEIPTDEQRKSVREQRGYSDAGALLCVRRGVLRIAGFESEAGDCYVMTDVSRICADHRFLSGKPFKNSCKSKSLYGWKRHWPMGIDAEFESGELGSDGIQGIIFTEGGPNLLAGYDLIQRAGLPASYIAVSMPGTSSKIPDAVLPFFTDKRIFFIPDGDSTGIRAMDGWQRRIIANSKPTAWDTLKLDLLGWTMENGEGVTDTNEILYAGDSVINQMIAWLREGKRPTPNCV